MMDFSAVFFLSFLKTIRHGMGKTRHYFYLWGIFLLVGCAPSIANLDSKGKTIICFGNSITEGVGASEGNDFPSLLAKKIGRPVINAGKGGETTFDALKRIEEDVLQKHPKLVIVELGGNDYLQKIPQSETFKNLDEMTRRIQAQGAMVVLAEIKKDYFMMDITRDFGKSPKKERPSLFLIS